jgi:DNA-binding beta-propeller fold protein YncE
MKRITVALIAIALCGGVCLGAAPGAPHYQIVNRFQVGGEGFWDLLAIDEATGWLYVAHSNLVNVVDTKTGKIVGEIPDTKGVHGIALAPDLHEGFASCGRDTSVVVFRLDSLKVVKRLTMTGRNPDAIVYEPSTHRVFCFNPAGSNATVIDAATNTIASTIQLDGRPELAVTDGKGAVYVNIEDKATVAVIGAADMAVKSEWPLSPGEGPTGIAIDVADHRLFVGCSNKMMIILGSDDGKVIANPPIGQYCDGTAYDPGLKRAYASTSDGKLTVVEEIDKNQFQVLENADTQGGARTLALDTKTHHIYLPTGEFTRPPATPDNPKPRPTIVPGTFVILEVAP